MIYIFIFGLFVNLLSGIKNACYYGHNKELCLLTCWLLLLVLGIPYITGAHKIFDTHPGEFLVFKWLLIASFVPSIFATCYMAYIFATDKTNGGKRIHVWEAVLQYGWFLAMACIGIDFLTLLCVAFAGNALFNMPIQYVATGRIINKVSRTDDATGKTEGIWIFGHEFKKPRISNGYVMTAIGAVAVLVFIANNFWLKTDFNMYAIIDWFKK